jgi:hypothetical protein
MGNIISLLALAIGVVSIICWIKVLIVIFNKAGVGLGILGIICPIFTFIWGWVKNAEYNLKKIMLIWTIATGASFVLNILAGATMVASPDFQKAMNDAAKAAQKP